VSCIRLIEGICYNLFMDVPIFPTEITREHLILLYCKT